MKKFMLDFWNEEDGVEVIEVIIILAVILVVAVALRDEVIGWAESIFGKIGESVDSIGNTSM